MKQYVHRQILWTYQLLFVLKAHPKLGFEGHRYHKFDIVVCSWRVIQVEVRSSALTVEGRVRWHIDGLHRYGED